MILLLVLWLCCIHFTNQETCSSPGDLPAPQMFLDKASSSQGDTVVMKCKIPALPPFTRVIFCKDGKEIAIQPMQQSKFAYDLHYEVSASSSGNFSCLYEHKDNLNHQTLSLLSTAQHLSVTGLSSKSDLGITSPSTLDLVVLCSLLVTSGFGY
ncbi:uncharacterized protein ACDP82_019811 isoform 2-T2 [Pangshura tecta]